MNEDHNTPKYYTMPLGPQHPALIEPEYLKVYLDGETITDVEINLGYMHRGIEKALQQRTYAHNLFLIERICGICSSVHTVTYCNMIENMMELKIPKRAQYIRVIIAELERLHSHFLWVGITAYEIGFDTLFQLTWRDREYIMDILEKISGNRVNYAMNTIGGVRRNITKEKKDIIFKIMEKVDACIHHYIDVFVNDSTITARTKNIGILSKDDAIRYAAIGPTARGSGIVCDIRKISPYLIYNKLEFKQITHNTEDIESRAVVRLKEMLESTKIIRQCLHLMPQGELSVKAPATVPKGETIARTEAPRGELFYYLLSDGTDKPYRIKIRTPTLANISSIKPMLLNQKLADLPIIVASIDPCFCCTERITLVDKKTGNTETVDETYIKSLERR
ncbi:MAG: nickel-dependent hydrogenase large subunit [archaeon]|nr:nickel-dependent hydrogenase large subunit [archaeon]